MRQIIESGAESGDGASIKREQPSTVFRSMPHYNDWTSPFHPRAQLGKERAGFTPVANRNGTANAADGGDILTGTFDALNETTNVRPAKGGSISIVHPAFKTGYDTGPIGSAEGIDRSIKGIPVTSFEDIGSGDQDNNDVVIGVRENVSGAFAFETGLPVEGLHDSVHCITAGCGSNVPFGSRFPTDNVATNSGPGGTTFMTETFEPAAGMDSFGESLNPVPKDGGFQPLEGASVEIGRPPDPKLWFQSLG
jgi:hypothetical protein